MHKYYSTTVQDTLATYFAYQIVFSGSILLYSHLTLTCVLSDQSICTQTVIPYADQIFLESNALADHIFQKFWLHGQIKILAVPKFL